MSTEASTEHDVLDQAALGALDFGQVDSESEVDLGQRFLRTADFERLVSRPRIDLILGPKGSGKSALFQLFARYEGYGRALAGSDALSDVLMQTGTGFRDATELSTQEIESLGEEERFDFEQLWMLYMALKAAIALGKSDLKSKGLLREFLKAQSAKKDFRILPVIKTVWKHLISGNPASGLKVTILGNTIEIGTKNQTFDLVDLLAEIDATAKANGKRVWLLFDNLDELFASKPRRRIAALSGLFAACNQLRGRFTAIEPKVFLRSDLWADLNFNNKSHWVGKELELRWTADQLLNLMVKRACVAPEVRTYLAEVVPGGGDWKAVDQLSSQAHRAAFEAIFGPKVNDDGSGDSLEWMLARSADGTGHALPRELITFGNLSKKAQLDYRYEPPKPRPGRPAAPRALITGKAVRTAYPVVSRIRCETFLSEFPELEHHFKRFRGQTTARFHRNQLERVMRNLTPAGEAMLEALADVGVLAPVDGPVSTAKQFEVPLVYRPGLGLRLRGRA
jgi:hypothetical protein